MAVYTSMLVRISYSDGQYSYRKLDMSDPHDKLLANEPDVCEVDDQIVALWDAISELDRAMGKQLCELDNKNWERYEASRNKSGS